MRRFAGLLLIAGFVTATLAGCSHQPPPPPKKETVNPLDRVDNSKFQPKNFLHKTFTVKTFSSFAVEVPPHIVIPRIHGTFTSFVKQGEDRQSDDSTDVSFLLMSADQYAEYARGNRQATALYTVDSSHSHEVGFLLPPTKEETVKYYVVFVNLPTGHATKMVDADFTLTLGY
ncbi:MAG TPA: hypothetical protein VK466_10350 [Terriglobales bacterium]|nr:hypothetical protein [Terriglobales bacterium]